MKVGITGTREGLTKSQEAVLFSLLGEIPIEEFHHGGCVGVDSQAAGDVELRGVKIVEHPGQPGTYFKRNREIVDAVDMLFVCPRSMEHERSGGTWYTHDHAVRNRVPVVVVWPDGSVTKVGA